MKEGRRTSLPCCESHSSRWVAEKATRPPSGSSQEPLGRNGSRAGLSLVDRGTLPPVSREGPLWLNAGFSRLARGCCLHVQEARWPGCQQPLLPWAAECGHTGTLVSRPPVRRLSRLLRVYDLSAQPRKRPAASPHRGGEGPPWMGR